MNKKFEVELLNNEVIIRSLNTTITYEYDGTKEDLEEIINGYIEYEI